MEIKPTGPSKVLQESVAHTTKAAAGTYINRAGRQVSATLGPVDQNAAMREESAARNNMITYRLA